MLIGKIVCDSCGACCTTSGFEERHRGPADPQTGYQDVEIICSDCLDNQAHQGDDDEPSHDDAARFCPDCERPNQFGGLCAECAREWDRDDAADERFTQDFEEGD